MQHNIKTFEDACKALNIDAALLPTFPALPEEQQKGLMAHYKLTIIAQALNEGWKPDWNNDDECKYYPWFQYSSGSSGFALSHCAYGYDRTRTLLGSRLVFKTADLAMYAGTQFTALYQEYFVIKP